MAALAGAALEEGTASRSAYEIAETAERLGGYLATGADWDCIELAISTPSRELDSAMALLADVVRNPKFPGREVERLQGQTIDQLHRRATEPGIVAHDAMVAAIYGKSRYGMPLLGEESSVRGLNSTQILEHFQRHVVPASAVLIAVGDLSPDVLIRTAAARFGDWEGRAPDPAEHLEPEQETTSIVVVDREAAEQSELRIGHASLPRNHRDYARLSVLTTLLGGKFTSRLNLRLREELAVTYGVHCSLAKRRGPGPLKIGAAVDTPAVPNTVREVLAAVERLRTEPATDDEVRDTVRYMVGTFPYTVETARGLSNRLRDVALYDLPDDYYNRLPEELFEVTPEELLETARSHLRPDRMTVAIAGPAKKIGSELEAIAPLRVVKNESK